MRTADLQRYGQRSASAMLSRGFTGSARIDDDRLLRVRLEWRKPAKGNPMLRRYCERILVHNAALATGFSLKSFWNIIDHAFSAKWDFKTIAGGGKKNTEENPAAIRYMGTRYKYCYRRNTARRAVLRVWSRNGAGLRNNILACQRHDGACLRAPVTVAL